MEPFTLQIRNRTLEKQSALCVGLDTVFEKIPEILHQESNPQLTFNRIIIDSTHDLTCCYKLNTAFYFVRGIEGVATLMETIQYARSFDVPVILDTKWGDIGHTAKYYAQTAFDTYAADAVTLNPYMGEDAISAFRDHTDKCSFLLCFTSNKTRNDLETQPVNRTEQPVVPFYQIVAEKIVSWNTSANLGAVVGATAPEELAKIRDILGSSIPILCPGIGAQGGDLEEVLWAGYSEPGSLVINVSRAIIHASNQSDFAEAACREAEMFVTQMRTFFSQWKET